MVVNQLRYEQGIYSIDFSQLEELMSIPSNKIMIICNPHNPVSKVWNDADLSRIVQLAIKYEVILISDEIFAEIVFKGHQTTPLLNIEHANEISVVLTSIGKSFNFTGFSHANAIISSGRIREKFLAQRRIDHYGSMNPFIREAIIAAYEDGDAWFDQMLEYVSKNIEYVEQFFHNHFPEVTVSPIEGTYLAWIDWNKLSLNDDQLERFLLEEAALDLDQGWHFGIGGSGFTRINLATPREQLVNALERLKLTRS